MANQLDGINVALTATVQNFEQGMKTAQSELAKTAIAAQKTDSSLAKFSAGSNQAGVALTNLGRVVQDAPYGFIGIANNINPLLESFQRLKAETGTTGGALKALVSSLSGPAGLGIAVSVATSLMLVFGGTLFKTSKQTDEAKKALDGYNESSAKEILKLNELIAVAKDENISRDVRLAAVQKLKSEYPNYLKGLSDEQILAGQLGSAYDKINRALLAKATLQAAEDKVLPILKEQVELQLKIIKARQTVAGLSNISDAELLANQKTAKLFVERKQAIQDLVEGTKAEELLQQKVNGLFSSLGEILKTSAPLDLVFKPDTEKAEKNLLDAVNRFDFTKAYLELQLRSREALKQVDLFGGKDGGLSGFSLPTIVPPPSPLIGLGDATNDKVTNNRFSALQDNIQTTADLLNKTLKPAFDAVFDAIANGQNVFQAVGEAIKRVVVQLVKAAIESAILALILSAIPGGSAAAGFIDAGTGKGLKFGGVFTKLLGGLFGHAEGGIITQPLVAGRHLFGEAGKEAVLPLDKINDYLRPAAQFPAYLPVMELRGDTLYLLYQRALNRFNKNN
jgi:hypothetical protein